MSVNKVDKTTGELTLVAGKNVSTMVPSVALQQSGTVTCNISNSDNLAQATVTFSTPMPDANYIINIEVTGWGGAGNLGTNISLSNKSKNGFVIRQYVSADVSTPSITYRWQAFRLVSDQTIALDEEAIVKRTAFPDYAHPINIGTVSSWTATEDVYITYNVTSDNATIPLSIDGTVVSQASTAHSTTTNLFFGYAKKGQVISGSYIRSDYGNCRIYPLLT